jgi:hypothetical protein
VVAIASCTSCGSTDLIVGYARTMQVPVTVCGSCSRFWPLQMPPEMVYDLLTHRQANGVVIEDAAAHG